MIEVERLEPVGYRRTPWKNGGGVSIEIAGERAGSREGAASGWSYGRTSILEPAPFSDWGGHDRQQVVIAGHGLVLVTPDGEIDLREPFQPQRYDGGIPIVTRLEGGGVEVANLIADRGRFIADLRVGVAGQTLPCLTGVHVVHAAAETAEVAMAGTRYTLAHDEALRIIGDVEMPVSVISGRVLIGSIRPRAA